MTTAIVLGATGLTGTALVPLLLEDERFTHVLAITRRSLGVTHAKLTEAVVDFEKPESWADLARGQIAFSTLGTTKRDAGSIAAQRRVDVDYQLDFAKAAAANDVQTFVLVSSAGADATSSFAYPKMKGELDDAVLALAIPRVRIMRPGPLEGARKNPRPGEKTGIAVTRFLANLGIAKKYRPILVEDVARAMIAAAFDGPDRRRTYTLDEVHSLASSR